MPDICECSGFQFWYVANEDGPAIDVCTCGHSRNEHLDGEKSCIGLTITLQ